MFYPVANFIDSTLEVASRWPNLTLLLKIPDQLLHETRNQLVPARVIPKVELCPSYLKEVVDVSSARPTAQPVRETVGGASIS